MKSNKYTILELNCPVMFVLGFCNKYGNEGFEGSKREGGFRKELNEFSRLKNRSLQFFQRNKSLAARQ
jgi:hypothetical protein